MVVLYPGQAVHNFKRDSKKEEKANNVVACTLWGCKGAPFVHGRLLNRKEDIPVQKRGIDMYLFLRSKFDPAITAEIKNCFRNTGNVSIELLHLYLDSGNETPGWFDLVQAELLYHFHIPSDTVQLWDLDGMRKKSDLLFQCGRDTYTYNEDDAGNIFKKTTNRIIPMRDMHRMGFIVEEYPAVYASSALRDELHSYVY